MDTSRAYYDDVMRQFKTNRRGRNLYQFCRDEGVDFKWLTEYKRQLASENKSNGANEDNTNQPEGDFIKLHFSQEYLDEGRGSSPTSNGGWTIRSMSLQTPDGSVVEIKSENPAAVIALLTRLTV